MGVAFKGNANGVQYVREFMSFKKVILLRVQKK